MFIQFTAECEEAFHKKTPVGAVVVGDFNLEYSDHAYETLKTLFQEPFQMENLYDIFRQRTKIPFTPTYEARNTMNQWKSTKRIDHIFGISKDKSKSEKVELEHVVLQSYSLLTQAPNEELSDHWGQMFSISL